ncbi:MAG: Flp pilus assembly protein CpaB [Alphaproteobacteria bacterium]
MRPITFILILLAIVFSGAAALMARKAIKQNQDISREKTISSSIEKVLVANRNIAAGETIKDNDIRWQDWPKKSVGSDFISGGEKDKFDYFIGRVAKTDFFENEIIIKQRTFNPEKSSVMSGMIATGKRAYGVPVSLQSGMTGFISPGDLVDVVLVGRLVGQNVEQQKQGALAYKNFSETILTSIKVLAVDSKMTKTKEKEETAKDKKKTTAKSLTLEVTPQEAEILAVAQKMGDLTFVLRPLVKEENVYQNKAFTGDLDASNLLSAMIRGSFVKNEIKKAPVSNNNNIKIYRGKEIITQ